MQENKILYWQDYLQSLDPSKIDLTLSRIKKVAERLDVLSFNSTVIIISGTNGKGSTVAFLEYYYLKKGLNVGSYISPHILRLNERVRINGHDIGDEQLSDALEQVYFAKDDLELTYFEFITLAAFYIFKNLSLDILILEVGMGGRLDAVNIVDADLAIITSIGLDHCQFLGHSRSEIAKEKFGIARPNKPLICGEVNLPEDMEQLAHKNTVDFYVLNQNFKYEIFGDKWIWHNQQTTYTLPKPQIYSTNAASAIQGIELLKEKFPISEQALKDAMLNAKMPGRFHVVRWQDKRVIFDVAHNVDSIKLLNEQLQMLSFRKIRAVFGMLNDKDILGCLNIIKNTISSWSIAPLNTPRSYNLAELKESVTQVKLENVSFYQTISYAFDETLRVAEPDDVLVVFGSFYVVSELYKRLQRIDHGEVF